ncbi:hypothetical protein IHQ68_02265 [Chelatococcus sambhunathii]|uniref:DUF6968 domain-containing protein n=1 Tax=Chelatococcus sambhunathii TaxID=363953 RepID=A0ABU1DBJ9_9HYPH|nr:hypothetical protein [Chelatococcus sambhunathii]MDR4305447.1 hypothetical protein [Chelatococcus sambhunathii]
MLIGTRTLHVVRGESTVAMDVRVYVPEPTDGGAWSCRYEIDWPERARSFHSCGVDAFQALELALKMVGSELYASEHHKFGRLSWLQPGAGYGFPVAPAFRDCLIGEDKTLL